MRPSLRFLALALCGWAGVRAATLGVLPGAEMFKVEPSEAKPVPPIAQTEFPPLEPVAPAPQYIAAGYPYAPAAVPVSVRPVTIPVYYASAPAPAPRPAAYTPIIPVAAPQFYAPIPSLDEWPLSRIASASMPSRQSTVVLPSQSAPAAMLAQRFDRLRLTAWALIRGQQGAVLGPSSLGGGGTLGGSQAGARLTYYVTPQVAASLRTTSDIGRRGMEVAGGVRVQPIASVPVWVTAERRQRLGRFTGRNDFALFAEAGVWQRPMPWHFSLDAYLQAGVVGIRTRDKFIDGGLTMTRPVYKQFSAGFGVWGGAQPGVYRLDAGPRVTMAVRNNVRVHFDWRQKLAGNAQPGSGPAITLAGDF